MWEDRRTETTKRVSSSSCCCHCLYMYFIPLFLVHVCSAKVVSVVLQQTIPQDGLACPNETLQYTCTSPGKELLLEVGSSSLQVFMESSSVNETLNFGDFVAVLVVQNETTISATITNERVTSSDSGMTIACAGGASSAEMLITIAGGPASCSNLSVPVCQISTHAGETQALILLSTNESLMCVVRFLIRFNGENRTVPVSSPSAKFSITITEGEPFDNEIIVYTLDYENRTGQMPCVFNSTELSGVKSVDHTSECDPKSLSLSVTFYWMEPSVLGGCLVSDTPLQYMYWIEFNDTQFTNNSTDSTSYQLMDVPQGTVVEITITPALPSQGLTGPPLTTTVNLVSIKCSTSSSSSPLAMSSRTSSTCPTPTSSPPIPGGPSDVAMVVALIVVAVLLLLLSVVTVLFVVILFFCFRKKHRKDTRLMMSTSAVQDTAPGNGTPEESDLSRKMSDGTSSAAQDKGEMQVSNPLSLLTAQASVEIQDTCIGRAVETDSTSEKHQVSPSRQGDEDTLTPYRHPSIPSQPDTCIESTVTTDPALEKHQVSPSRQGNGGNQTADPPIARSLDSSSPQEEGGEEEEAMASGMQDVVPPVGVDETETIPSLKQRVAKLTKMIHDKSRKIQGQKDKIQDLKNQVAEQEKITQHQKQEIQDLKRKVAALSKEVAERTREAEQGRTNREDVDEFKGELSLRLCLLTGDTQTRDGKIRELELQLKDAESAVSKLKQAVCSTEMERQQLAIKVYTLETLSARKDLRIAEYEAKIKLEERAGAEMTEKIAHLKQQLIDAERPSVFKDPKVDEQIKEKDFHIVKLTRDIEAAKSRIKEKDVHIVKLIRAIDAAKSRIKEKDGWDGKISELELQLKDAKSKILHLEQELEAATRMAPVKVPTSQEEHSPKHDLSTQANFLSVIGAATQNACTQVDYHDYLFLLEVHVQQSVEESSKPNAGGELVSEHLMSLPQNES